MPDRRKRPRGRLSWRPLSFNPQAYCLAKQSGMSGSDAADSEAVNERRLLRTIAKAIPDLA
jgi:hypothetical protein